ncbi:Gfo/Idh/MocA family oxidoreductase [Palleronia sp. LCG004]|uniref:Gfo/Idh/MocA family protein n=1 Tax=Palleronia sp. LCG004 TaxID=3079304 RepID=UPI00294254ED|nr:Gfo/Idh/MocA family oxidoreductase [Palleronia sp. LCG004]WOI55238.1 Gfo/Idh/MocA family oxidoreductase [Palleronia sp. LCG004]
MSATRIAIVGVGKIAHDQHIPAIADSPDFELAATVSGSGGVDGIENYESLTDLLDAREDIRTIVMTMPPVPRFEAAREAIAAGRDVLLEKPPGVTVAEVRQLADLAEEKGTVLYASWHLRHALGVADARDWLARRKVTGGHISWKENVRVWHPGQQWIWEPGGQGVFDTGINALSILTEILPAPVRLRDSVLRFPENRDTPIAVDLTFVDMQGAVITADFDWRLEETASWTMEFQTEDGTIRLEEGAAILKIDGVDQGAEGPGEYPGLYRHFATLLRERRSDVDDRPLVQVADAFLFGRREIVEPFDEA